MKTTNRTCVITESAIRYLLLLGLGFTSLGAMVWFYVTFMARATHLP
ncbi:MAG: hypothetical protein KKC55_15080 [Gammaproteobacteria bacterium]|nr:hypothetical protein [Gammaproteobacteria bacterium]